MTDIRQLSLRVLVITCFVAKAVSAAEAIPTPPAEYCAKLGAKAAPEKRADGVEIDVCTFEGGRQCEAWALYRLQCPPGGVTVEAGISSAARYCLLRGGKYSSSGKGQCTFDTGRTCDITEYFIGKCD
jgi:putative hemolysin